MNCPRTVEAPLLFVVTTLAFLTGAPAAFADDKDSDTAPMEVVITGSRIARPELESTTPVTIVSAPEIQSTGFLNAADVLRNLPQVGVSGISGSNSNFSTSGGGINTIDLRNLGDNRTLVLVNGRRMVSGYTAGALNVVDINMIPTDFIERVDVITGGASAVYGSEAIAGVVNFVLKDHFEGVRVRAQGGGATEGGENTRLGSLTAGSSFAEDRGAAMINIEYDKDSGLRSAQRAISTTDTSIAVKGITGAFSSFNPQGNVFFADANGNLDDEYTFNKNNAVVPYATSLGYNRDAVRRITIPVDRTLISGLLHYKFAEKQQVYTEFIYGHTHTETDIEPFAIGIGPAGTTDNVYGGTGLGIPLTNAYIPAALQSLIAADNADPNATGGCSTGVTADCITYLGVRKRLVDVNIRSSEARRQTMRVVGGVKGDIFSTPWTYDVSYNYGRTTDNQQSTGQVNVLNLRYALDSIVDPTTGKIVCRDPVAQAQGCVPVNVFGFNSITPAMVAYINALENREAVIQEQIYSAIAQGPVFKLPAGDIIAVVGAEHRTEQSSEVWDALTNAGLNGGNALPNTFGSYTVKDIFAETSVPLLSGKPGVKDLSIESAFRSSDYNTVGRVSTWNLRLNFAPMDDVRFRGAYSRATRAPNLSELYQGASQTFPTGVADPCDGITAGSTGAIASACKAIPAVANAINSPGGFKYTFLDYQIITGFNAGNPHLQPETAKTYTAGLVFTPTFLRNFTATFDYYNIKIDNAVGSIDIPTLLNQCLLTGSPTYCDFVFRDPNTGKLTRIDQVSINTATMETAGVDTALNYRMELPAIIGDSLGFALNWNWLQKLDVINQPGAPVVHYKGQIAEVPGGIQLPGGPANRVTLQAQYNRHGLTAGWTVRYQGPMKDQVDLTQVSAQQLPFNSVPAYTYHDVQLSYLFGENKLKTKLYGGIRNLFDKKPPFLPTGMQTQITGTETAPSSYDAIGRVWFAGLEAEF